MKLMIMIVYYLLIRHATSQQQSTFANALAVVNSHPDSQPTWIELDSM
jgi:hypothetical protein